MEDKKQRLISALKDELDRFHKRNLDTLEHDVAIDYLEFGLKPDDFDEYKLLDVCINDIETLYSDYEIK